MSNGNRLMVLSLYKNLLKEARKFSDYNYREYFVRRIQDTFRNHMITVVRIEKLIADGNRNLEMLKRQTAIDNMYHSKDIKHYMEKHGPKSSKK